MERRVMEINTGLNPKWDSPIRFDLIALKDCFLPSTLDVDGSSPKKERFQELFLDSVFQADVMKETKRFLVERKLAPAEPNAFKNLLRALWFSSYKRGKRENTCGFEHVFLGEKRGQRVLGFHYWLTFYLREKSGEINYLGSYIRFQSRTPMGALYAVAFEWDKVWKKNFARFLIGSSPEFDMALYTAVFLTANQRTPKQFRLGVSLKHNSSRIAVQCYKLEQTKIGTCYIV
ncbi:unnamed protein product [Dibothriocephalus latus]|uniref:Uridylate-specific endoribonuclease n=1 Tax=Dibothriocephalus latus TaxID=60516 RepID=A0A3P7KVN8_DIBLA|nr:unnamed protein product [Dibothriocephalus latus]